MMLSEVGFYEYVDIPIKPPSSWYIVRTNIYSNTEMPCYEGDVNLHMCIFLLNHHPPGTSSIRIHTYEYKRQHKNEIL